MKTLVLIIMLSVSQVAFGQDYSIEDRAKRINQGFVQPAISDQNKNPNCTYKWVSVYNPNTMSYTQVYICK